MNLLVVEEHPGLEYRYSYHPDTDLLSAKYTIYDGKIRMREFYGYDDYAAPNLEIVDDGSGIERHDLTDVTERRIKQITNTDYPPKGLPFIICEKYLDLNTHSEVLTKKIENYYSGQEGWLRVQCHTDCYENLAYKLEWKYDWQGNPIQEMDALGQTITRAYDENKNITHETTSGKTKRFTYDFMDRCIREEEQWDDGTVLVQTSRYDAAGQKIASTDAYGQETLYAYDLAGRVSKITAPCHEGTIQPVVLKEYDPFGNVISITNPLGHKTTAAYTTRGKPYLIQYPDGTSEKFRYTLKGELSYAEHKDKSYTCYAYDPLSRLVRTEDYSSEGTLLKSTSAAYNAFHKLTETDALGHATHFSYDGAGRLIKREKANRIVTYAYDRLGRVALTKECDGHDFIAHIQVYDNLDRIIEERKEDATGQTFWKEEYEYDHDGNRCTIKKFTDAGMATTSIRFLPGSKVLDEIDPLGNLTHHRHLYNYRNHLGLIVPYEEVADPMGIRTVTIGDALQRTTSVEVFNPFGTLIQKAHYDYDAASRCVKTVDVSLPEGKEIITSYQYDRLDRLTAKTEAVGTPEQKHTRFSYNVSGQLETIVKADGIKIFHTYDALGRLKEYSSSDGSVHYSYHYDLNDNPIRIQDLITHTATIRQYNPHNEMIEEKLGHGLDMTYRYDNIGRCIEVTYPDQSGVSYSYTGEALVAVKRFQTHGTLSYAHTYDKRDLSGRVLEATLIDGGKFNGKYDLANRPIVRAFERWKETDIQYNSIGLMTHRSLEDAQGITPCSYIYDDTRQLMHETGFFEHRFVNDSLYNHLSKDGIPSPHNALHHILTDGIYQYSYDILGNRRQRGNSSDKIDYNYDALDP